jgi:hypothetical protein
VGCPSAVPAEELLLLRDLRAQLAAACHPQTLRQMRWANTLIKQLSPQVLTSL